MGKPLMIQLADDRKIEALKKKLNAKSKVAVVRSALDLLEKEVEKTAKFERWKRAAHLVAESSREVMKDFQGSKRFRD